MHQRLKLSRDLDVVRARCRGEMMIRCKWQHLVSIMLADTHGAVDAIVHLVSRRHGFHRPNTVLIGW